MDQRIPAVSFTQIPENDTLRLHIMLGQSFFGSTRIISLHVWASQWTKDAFGMVGGNQIKDSQEQRGDPFALGEGRGRSFPGRHLLDRFALGRRESGGWVRKVFPASAQD